MAVQCTAADGDEMHEGPLSLYPLSDADARAANNVMHEVVPVVQSGFLLWERESKCPRAQVANTKVARDWGGIAFTAKCTLNS